MGGHYTVVPLENHMGEGLGGGTGGGYIPRRLKLVKILNLAKKDCMTE